MQLIETPDSFEADAWVSHIETLEARLAAGEDVGGDLNHARKILAQIRGEDPAPLSEALSDRVSAKAADIAAKF